VRCFVYGTLTDPDTAAEVLPSFSYDGPATLHGLHRVDGAHPTLLPGGTVNGRILTTPAVETLDHYEGVGRGLYVRVTLPCDDGGTVETYVGDPARLGVDDGWSSDGPFADCVRSYLDDHDVRVAIDAA
jgi:gamma-glutamylaminecyclotransferase